MRRIAVVGLLILATARAAKGQADEFKTTLVISVFAGGTTGGTLWSQSSQPVPLINNLLRTVGTDTFSLRRTARPGITIGSSATLFRTPRFGFGIEVSYNGPDVQDDCSVVFSDVPTPGSPEARIFNDAFCSRINAAGGTLGSISLLAEGILVAAPNGRIRPFARLAAGVTDVGRSTAEISGPFAATDVNGDGIADAVNRPIIIDDNSSTAGFTFGGGLGFLFPLSRVYAIRLEVRDQIFRRSIPLGPADVLGRAEIGKSWFHSPSVVVGFALNMQRARGRVHRGR